MGSVDAWEGLVEMLGEESRRARDADLRGALMTEAGRILIDWLGRQEEGDILLRRSRSPLADLVKRSGRGALALELAALEQAATDAASSPEDRAAAWIEFGLLSQERTRTHERALDAYATALKLVPNQPVAIALVAQVARAEGAWPTVQGQLETIAAETTSPAYRVALRLELAELQDDPAAALEHLELAREIEPTDEGVVRRWVRATAASGRRDVLGGLYLELAGRATDHVSSASFLHRAVLAMLEADQPIGGVIEALERLAAERPTSSANRPDLIAPLAEVARYVQRHLAAGRPAAEVRHALPGLHLLAEALDDAREQALVHEQLARLELDALPEVSQATTGGEPPRLTVEQLALCDELEGHLRFCQIRLPGHRWVHEALADLLAARDDSIGLAAHLEEWSRTQDAGAGRAAILLRLADVYETRRRDFVRAAEIYELAVAEDPDNPNCVRGLGRIYEQMRRWPAAVACLRQQANKSDDSLERLAALRRIAMLAETELHDLDLAIASLEEVAKLDPDDLLSLYQLVRLCRAGKRPLVHVAALNQLSERIDDNIARTALLVELGEVQEMHLDQPEAARGCYEQALALSPGYAPALRALTRLARNRGDHEELLRLLQPTSDTVSEPAVLALRSARLCEEDLGDLSRAARFAREAYEQNPDLVPAREMLLRLLIATGGLEEAYDLLRAQDVPRSSPVAADYHYRLGLLAEALAPVHGPEAGPAAPVPTCHANALQHYRAALACQPDHGLAFERARALLVAYHDIGNLVRLLESRLANAGDAERAVSLVHLGRVHVAHDVPLLARRAYEEALSIAPEDPIIRHEFVGLLRLMGDRKSLPPLYLRSARDTADTHLKATLLVEAAELLLSTGATEDHELAGKAILEALQVDPGNPYAVRHLERLLSEPDSPFVVKDAVSARAVRAQSEAERAIFYVESAELLEKVGAWGQARRAYVAAKGALPSLAPADLGLRRTGNENRRTAVQAPGRTSIHVLIAEARDASLRAGRGDAAARQKALQIITEVLARDPQHRDAIAIGRTLVGQPGDPKAILRVLATAFEKVEDIDLRYELGLFLGGHSPSLEDGVRFFQAAATARPNGRRALRGLVNAYRQLGNDRMAAAATERLLELFEPAEPSAIDLRMGIANFLSTSRETLPRALEHGRIVLEARPNDPRAVALMAELLERSGKRLEAARLIDRLVARERNRERLHDLFLRKARLLSGIPGTNAETLNAIERAAALNPSNRDTITMLVDQLAAAGQTARVATYLPPIRNALQANVARGAVSLRDLNLLAKVAAPQAPDLAAIAASLLHALDPTEAVSAPPPVIAGRSGMRRLIDNPQARARVICSAEPPALHALLQALDGAIARMAHEFPEVSTTEGPTPQAAMESAQLRQHARVMAELVGLRAPRLGSSTTNDTVLFLPDPSAVVRLGDNLWATGDADAWRGLVGVAIIRAALGGSRARALSPGHLDVLIAACFQLANVFNPTTTDPDPRLLRNVVAELGNALSRKQRSVVETNCRALATHAFDTNVTAKTTTLTDLRYVGLLSGNFTECLSAACLLDGVPTGPLKQRVGRSNLARDLLSYFLSDEFLAARGIARPS